MKRLYKTLIWLGLLTLLTMAIVSWPADSNSQKDIQQFEQQKTTAAPTSTTTEPTYQLKSNDLFAVIRIPKIGLEYPVREGTDLSVLKTAVGHYIQTQGPGQTGNFALAGHVCCSVEPFKRINELRPGDIIIIETSAQIFTYTVVTMPACGTKLPLIVDEHVTEVIDASPCSQATPTEQLLTLTTCTPYGPSATPLRLIVWAVLTD